MSERRGASSRFLTTVLMTDIVGSTELAAEIGDSAWHTLVGEHNRIVRAALRRHNGRELDTAGDGFFATFDAPASAVACALDAGRDLAALGLAIRAGVHVGEVEQVGRKVGGIAVPIAARIMGVASGGEVLVSGTARELASGGELTFIDRGTHSLKGLPGEWHVYAATRKEEVTAETILGDGYARRAAAVRRVWSRPIWQRHPRLIALLAVALAGVIATATLLVTKPWQPPALAAIAGDAVGVIDDGRAEIVASIAVDSQPGGLAVADGVAWASSTGANTVSQIDMRSRVVTRVIDVGRAPLGIAVAGGSVWVANSGGRTVTRINAATGRVVGEIIAGNGPVAATSAGDSVWVANFSDSTLVRVDATSGAASAPIPVAAGPVALTADSSGLWVASADGAAVTHLDQTSGVTLSAPITLPSRPVAIAAGSGAVWVASADGTLTRIDSESDRVTATLDVGGRLSAIAVTGYAIWAADRQGYVLRFDATDLSAPPLRIATGSSAEALAADGGQLWVAARAAARSHRGGTLRVVALSAPEIDPAGFSSATRYVADGLIGYRRTGGAAGASLVPDLALAIPRPTAGGLSYTFQLRPGLTYSTGVPVRPVDFRRAVERSFMLTDPFPGEALGPSYFAFIAGADACIRDDLGAVPACDLSTGITVDDATNTITFNLSRPEPDFLYLMANSPAFPVPEGVPLTTWIDDTFPGTGPYQIAERDATHLRLTRNPTFRVWNEDARPDGFPDEIVWTTVESADEAASMVERGDADYMRLELDDRLSPDVFGRISGTLPGQLHFASNSVTSITMNTALAPFDNVAARQAVNLAIDRARVVDLRGGPLEAAVSCQILPPGWSGYRPYCPYSTHPDAGGRWQAPDLNAARRLIDESGTGGAKVTVGPTLPIFTAERDYLVDLLIELGYQAMADSVTDFDHVNKAHFEDNLVQISVWQWFGASLSPGDFLRPFTCGRNEGTTNFCDANYDALVGHALELQQSDPAAAVGVWAEADQRIVDAAPWAVLYNEGSDFVSARVGNYQFHSFYLALLDQMWVQ